VGLSIRPGAGPVKGQWLVIYAASFFDGSTVAVDPWEGEVVL